MKSVPKYLIFSFLFIALAANLYLFYITPTPYAQAKKYLLSFSKGDRYFSRLSLWYLYAQADQWQQARQLEIYLDPADLEFYKSLHHPQRIKKQLNQLIVQKNKTIEDWIRLAQVQYQLGKTKDALNSITQARKIDPLRPDINQIFYQLQAQD